MSNNNGEELDELYLKYFPLNSSWNLASSLPLYGIQWSSIHPSSKAFSLCLSSLIFPDVWGTAFHTCPLKASGFSSETLLLSFLSSSPSWSLYYFYIGCLLFSLYLSSHFSSKHISLMNYCFPCVSCFFKKFYRDSFVFTKLCKLIIYSYLTNIDPFLSVHQGHI